MRILFFLSIIFSGFSLNAQSSISIEGTILDGTDQSPVAFSHITIKDSGIGTVANEDGAFIFKIPERSKADTIQISAIGYKTYSFLLSDINGELSDLKITLAQESKVLDEVLVTPIKTDDLIQMLVAKIPRNYGRASTELTGFYRETVKINNEFYSYLEGVIGAFKTGYQDEDIKSDQVKIIKGRRREGKITKDSTRRPPRIVSGPITINSYDIIKKRSNFVNAKKSKFYEYDLTDITTYNGRDIYVVDFKAKKESKKAIGFGTLYIDMESTALLRADYQLNAVGIDIINKKNISNGKRSNIIVTAKSFQATIDYGVKKGLWSMSQLRLNLGFDYYIKNLAVTDHMDLGLHLITTDQKLGGQPFNKEDIFKSKRAFASNLGDDDPDFWENYNILKQDERLKEAFEEE